MYTTGVTTIPLRHHNRILSKSILCGRYVVRSNNSLHSLQTSSNTEQQQQQQQIKTTSRSHNKIHKLWNSESEEEWLLVTVVRKFCVCVCVCATVKRHKWNLWNSCCVSTRIIITAQHITHKHEKSWFLAFLLTISQSFARVGVFMFVVFIYRDGASLNRRLHRTILLYAQHPKKTPQRNPRVHNIRMRIHASVFELVRYTHFCGRIYFWFYGRVVNADN